MSAPSKTKSKAELFLVKIRRQYSETLNFQESHIAERAMTFRNQKHSNVFGELLDEWQDYRDENGCEEDSNTMETNDDLPALPEITKQSTTDQPDTIEEHILERHIREMLYSIIIASHYKMKQRKDELMQQLFNNKKTKPSEIIIKYLPTNDETMKQIITHIFEEIVQKHYKKCEVFVSKDLCRNLIITYIKNCCKLSFEMLICENELSFFPLLFTDQKTSYISPVVRYDRIIKKNEKKTHKARAQSLGLMNQNSFLALMKQNKAGKTFMEGKVYRDAAAVDSDHILYYTFPGVIMKTETKDKILEKATVFTYADPIIFLRHDLNWIFSDKYFRKQTMNKFVRDQSFDENDAEDPFVPESNETDPYFKIDNIVGKKMGMIMDKIAGNSNVIKKTDFIGKAQLIQDWTSFKKQKHSQLCEELCEFIMDQQDDSKSDDDDDDEEEDEEDDDDDDDDDEQEYECNKLASKILFELMMKSRDAMKLKTKSNHIANNKDNISYLNMCNLYKYFTNYKENEEKKMKEKIDFKHGYIVQSIVNSTFEQVIEKKKKYKEFEFLKTNKKLNQKLHEYIALCCELICNIFHHQWDVCPIKLSAKKKSLHRFDEKIHIKDDELSMEECGNKIGYCCFPGIITKSCWSQFNVQYGKNQLNDEEIQAFIKSKMWVCLIK